MELAFYAAPLYKKREKNSLCFIRIQTDIFSPVLVFLIF